MMGETALLPGARELIVALKERGHRVVLASSGKPHHVDRALDLLDARDLADAWTTSEDVEETKPAPDLLQVALEKLGEPVDAPSVVDRRLGLRRRGGEERRDAGDRRPLRRLRRRRAARRRRARRLRHPGRPHRRPGRDRPAADPRLLHGESRRGERSEPRPRRRSISSGWSVMTASTPRSRTRSMSAGRFTVHTWTSLPAAWASATKSGVRAEQRDARAERRRVAQQQLPADRAQPLADQLDGGHAGRQLGHPPDGELGEAHHPDGGLPGPLDRAPVGQQPVAGAGSRPAPPRPCGCAGSGAWSRSPGAGGRGVAVM